MSGLTDAIRRLRILKKLKTGLSDAAPLFMLTPF